MSLLKFNPKTHEIFANLNSFTVDAGLSLEEKELLYLRKRSFVAISRIVSVSSYLVELVDKQVRKTHGSAQKELESLRKKTRTRGRSEDVPRLKIGIIGGGRVGTLLLTTLLTYNNVRHADVTVSTRRPESLKQFENEGVCCISDNEKVARESDLIFLCCLPSHFHDVTQDIRGHIKGLLVSVMAGVSLSKLCCALKYDSVIKVEFPLPTPTAFSQLTFKDSIVDGLRNTEIHTLIWLNGDELKNEAFEIMMELFLLACVHTLVTVGCCQEEILRNAFVMLFGETEAQLLFDANVHVEEKISDLKIAEKRSVYKATFHTRITELLEIAGPETRKKFWLQYLTHFVKPDI